MFLFYSRSFGHESNFWHTSHVTLNNSQLLCLCFNICKIEITMKVVWKCYCEVIVKIQWNNTYETLACSRYSIDINYNVRALHKPLVCHKCWSPYMMNGYRISFCCCCSVTKSCLTLCDPMDCSMPGFPVPHHLPEFAQVHVHWVSDAIQFLPSVIPIICF